MRLLTRHRAPHERQTDGALLILPPKAHRLARFSLTTGDADRLSAFYAEAFGCRRLGTETLHGPDVETITGVQGGARSIRLALGEEIIELLEFANPGAPYPARSSAADQIFQHFAVVARDITAAWLHLLQMDGWSPITTGSPQRLPDSSGGVTAFKFRDPDGHPIELLEFPAGHMPAKWKHNQGNHMCQGIDHSAIGVSDTAGSISFYETLGLGVSSQSCNTGPEQDNLDGLAHVSVEVTGLAMPAPSPHVELLCYVKEGSHPSKLRANDVAATRLVFDSDAATAPSRLTDPDGHHLVILPSPTARLA